MRGLLADVWSGTYVSRGDRIHGSRHFAPGETLFVSGPHSGDGLERTYLTGRHRDGRWASMLGPTARLVDWRVGTLTDPGWIAAVRGATWDRWTDADLVRFASGMNARSAHHALLARRWRIPAPVVTPRLAAAAEEVAGWVYDAPVAVRLEMPDRTALLTVQTPSGEGTVHVLRDAGKRAEAGGTVTLARRRFPLHRASDLVRFVEPWVAALGGGPV
jgi:hypothetical protein